MSKQKQPPIVAELGRPETPEETFARKAESSRLYRKRKTINNLVYSLLVSLGLVVFIVAIVPRNETPVAFDVDFASEAQSAQGDFAVPSSCRRCPPTGRPTRPRSARAPMA